MPHRYTHTEADLRVEATSDYLSIGGRVNADSLRLPRLGFDRIKGDFSMDVDGLLPAEEQISPQGTFQADSLRLLGKALPSPLLTVNLKDRQGALAIVTKGSQRTGPQQIATRFELLPDRNRWHIEDLFLSIGNSSWIMEDKTYLDLFDRAIIIPGLKVA
jgi:hypothetical protein